MTDPLTQAEAALAKMQTGERPYVIGDALRADLPAFEAIVAELRERREGERSRFEVAMLNAKLADYERQMRNTRSTLHNVMANIRTAAEEQDYDEIIAECERWGVNDE